MNRWLTRKKDAGDDAAAGKKAKKGKKGQEEVKPEFNLDAALPKIDDFRTSLIMPGLSTRFSMLREQDDPSSKMGKASDDSVLQPKRQSRLHEFGFVPGGLSDIAEVTSLNGSIRPPFTNERQDSFDSREEDDGSGSMMTRARPGEGNVLFGGRQKIYMISNNSSKGLGRTLYDDDVNMSAYQKLRQEEKDRLRQQEADEQSGLRSEPSSPSTHSRLPHPLRLKVPILFLPLHLRSQLSVAPPRLQRLLAPPQKHADFMIRGWTYTFRSSSRPP
jgi:hypothetical protein